MLTPDLSEARRLLGAGLQLVRLKPESKAPEGLEWNKHPVTQIDADATGYGVLLARNKLCSIDPDRVDLARIGMKGLGFDLDQLMAAGVRTVSTRPGSGGRSTFAAEGDLSWLTFSSSTGTVLELRADSPNLQDCVPGLVYRDKAGRLCTQQYANGRKLDEAPPLPDGLYEWWSRCSTDINFYREQQGKFFAAIGELPNQAVSGKGGKLAYQAPGLRSAFNARHSAEDYLDRHGYTWHAELQRWAAPAATGEPGIAPIPGRKGLWCSHHASDPLQGTFDAWTAYVVLEHQGDLEAARAAAELELGLTAPEQELPPVELYEAEAGHFHGAVKTETDEPLPYELRHLADILNERREPEWLIHQVLERNVLSVLAGPRATFKSFAALDWCMRVAADGQPVVILSGEGGGLDRRVDAWLRVHGEGLDLSQMPIRALERPLNLNATAELETLRRVIGPESPALILVDTLSKYSPGMEENSNSEVAAYLSRLTLELRQVYGCTVLLVAHTGHGDAKRPRGASALMANCDSEFIVSRDPETMTVQVSRERYKDCASLPPLANQAEVIDLGRTDKHGDRVTSLALKATEATMQTSRPGLNGKNQRLLLAALEERQKEAEHPLVWSPFELRRIGRLCGLQKNSARAAADALSLSPFMVPTVGGCRLATPDDK